MTDTRITSVHDTEIRPATDCIGNVIKTQVKWIACVQKLEWLCDSVLYL